jgi:hypothetical protein
MTDRSPTTSLAALPLSRALLAPLLAAIAWPWAALATETSSGAIDADDYAAESRAAEPAHDRILLISTRAIGTRCTGAAMTELRYEQYVPSYEGRDAWRPMAPAEAAVELTRPRPTIVYVHGNRVASGVDKTTGLAVYRLLKGREHPATPIRYIIWSWPSTRIPGPLRDYEVKAARTRPAGWQLAWALDRLPPETPLALVGYSYGARVVTGALHLLAGGNLNDLKLVERAHPQRPPIRTALVAAAEDANWLRPGGYHGHAMEQVERLLLINNQRDPAMRFYRLSPVGQGRALGFDGLSSSGGWGQFASRVHSVDVSDNVGRHHALVEYLTAAGPMGRALEQVAKLPPAPLFPAPTLPDSTVAGREAVAERE